MIYISTVKDVLSSTNSHSQILYTQLHPVVTNYIDNMHTKFNDSVTDSFFWPIIKMETTLLEASTKGWTPTRIRQPLPI
jgi:hypothetical protein